MYRVAYVLVFTFIWRFHPKVTITRVKNMVSSTWLRVDTDRPARFAAPSHAPPPTIEGTDKMYEAPMHLRSLSYSSAIRDGIDSNAHDCKLFVFQFPAEERMGNVSVVCGGRQLKHNEAQKLAAFAVNALRCTDAKGALELFDSAVTRISIEWAVEQNNQYDDDGTSGVAARSVPALSTLTNNKRFLLKSQEGGGNETMKSLSPKDIVAIASRPVATPLTLFWEIQKPNTHHFVTTTSAVPMYPLFCLIVPRSRETAFNTIEWPCARGESWMIVSPAALNVVFDATQPSVSKCKPFVKTELSRALRVYRTLFLTAARLISSSCTAQSELHALGDMEHASAALINATDPVFFFAAFTLSGLVVSSESFLSQTTHWEKMMVSSLVMNSLIPKGNLFDMSIDTNSAQAIRVIEIPIRIQRCTKSGKRGATLVVVTTGSAAALAFCFPDAEGAMLKSSSFVSFVKQSVMSHDTVSRVYSEYCRRNEDVGVPSHRGSIGTSILSSAQSPQRQRSSEISGGGAASTVPVFPGLQGRGTASRDRHITICTADPTDAASGKLLDDISSSDNDDGGETFCGCAVGDTGSAAREAAELRVSAKKMEAVALDAVDGLLLRCCSRIRRLDEQTCARLHAAGVSAYACTLQCSQASNNSNSGRSQQRLLSFASTNSEYRAFEVSWWRHLAVRRSRGLGDGKHASLPSNTMHTLLSDMVTCLEELEVKDATTTMEGESIAPRCDWTYIKDKQQGRMGTSSAVDEEHPQQVEVAQSGVTVLTHTIPSTLPSIEHSCSMVSSAAFAAPLFSPQSWCNAPEVLQSHGFNAPSTLIAERTSHIDVESWRMLKSLHRLSVGVVQGTLFVQRGSLSMHK